MLRNVSKKIIKGVLIVIFVITLILGISSFFQNQMESSNVMVGSCCRDLVNICNAGGSDHKGYHYSNGGCEVEK